MYRLLALLVPPAVVTRTLALPRLPAGVVQLIWVSLMMTTLLQALPPMVTLLVVARPVPLMVMIVPPAMGPAVGDAPVVAGTGA